MDFFTAMEVSASGLSTARAKMNVSASNLANAQTTQSADGGPYKRHSLVVSAVPVPGVDGVTRRMWLTWPPRPGEEEPG